MPTHQLVAMLNVTPPRNAVGLLMSMPTERVTVLLASMDLPDLARILAAADPGHKATLLELLDLGRVAAMISGAARPEAVALLAALTLERAAAVLDPLPANRIAALLSAMPPVQQTRLLKAIHPYRAAELQAFTYDLDVAHALGRTAATVTRIIGDRVCSFQLKAWGRLVAVAVRHLDEELLLTMRELLNVQTAMYNAPVAGVLLVTNVPRARDLVRYEEESLNGRPPTKAVTWRTKGDDGALKRAVVQLAQ